MVQKRRCAMKHGPAVSCPDCGADRTRSRGALDDRGTFAGKVVSRSASYLRKCSECDLAFRSPTMAQADVLSLYAATEVAIWQQATPPVPWTNIYRRLAIIQPSSVLDYGCFAGDFLRMLPLPCAKFGVEPSVAGSETARKVGVNILGKTHLDLPADVRFDVITVLDVVEHVAQPSLLLHRLAQHLNPGGILILLTGAQDSLWFRLFAPRYWYCAIPEHLVFISQKWCQRFATNNGLAVAAYDLIAYEPKPPPRMLLEWARTFAYSFVLPWLGRFPSVAAAVGLGGLLKWQVTPALVSWKDHVIVVLKRPS
jgi:SAM-dependent methyltransferase